MGHPFGPQAEHHIKTQDLVKAITTKRAKEIMEDLGHCTNTSSCLSQLHHRDCPVHP